MWNLCEIRAKLVRDLCEIIAKFVVHVIRVEIRIMRNSDTLGAKFVQNSRKNGMQCVYPTNYAAQRNTYTSHRHVIDHSPDFACFGGL